MVVLQRYSVNYFIALTKWVKTCILGLENMPQNEKRFRIVSVLLSFVVLGLLSFALFAPTNAITFDPANNIKKSLQLPDTNPENIAISTVQWALGLLGLVSVIMIIAGGFMWMTSAGNETRITKGKEIIKWAIVGMMVIFLSWAIVTFVFTSIEV